ncbi:Gfo/Idh/MocA family protein [Humidesulfovibrio idahonensis]
MSANGKKLGVAVVGLGVGEQHARAYLREGGCRLLWLHDLDRAKAETLAATLGAGRVAPSFEAILADPEVDTISLATYDADHAGQVAAALAAGKHVFVEKPVCRTMDEVRRVRQAWLEAGGPDRALSSNLVLRAAPLYRRLRAALDEGALGRIYALDGEYLYGRLHKITQGWRSVERDYSVMAGGGVHLIDMALWLTGLRPVRISAVGNAICTEGTAFRHQDFVTATAELTGGAIARFTANFGCVHRHQHVLRIYGTKGTFIYDDAGARLHASRDPAEPPQLWTEAPLPAGKGDLIADFVRGIREGRDWAREVQTMLDVVAVCAASDEALRDRRTVQVEYS